MSQKRIGKSPGTTVMFETLGGHTFYINEVKTETMLYAERFEIDDWEDLTKFLKYAVTKVKFSFFLFQILNNDSREWDFVSFYC